MKLSLLFQLVSITAITSAQSFTEELVLTVSADATVSYNVGQSEFNAKFWASSGILKRVCSDCADTHALIYYQRLTDETSFDLYSNVYDSWYSSNNILNTDFKLYSTIDDLLNEENDWQVCNYDDTGVGAFRDCGPITGVGCQWVTSYPSRASSCSKSASFYILTADEQWFYIPHGAGAPVRCSSTPGMLECASDDGANCKWGTYGSSWTSYQNMSGVNASDPYAEDCPAWGTTDGTNACEELGCYDVLAAESACFNAVTVGSETFNAPQDGIITGIRLVHASGSVSCNGAAYSNWGCNNNMIGVQLMRVDDSQILYPQSDTEDVTMSGTCPTECAAGADAWWYFTDSLSDIDSQLDELSLTDPEYAVTTNQSFKLVYGEACCQHYITDNSGTSCADVYFTYAHGCEDPLSFVWEDLMEEGEAYANKPDAVATLSVDNSTLSLNIEIVADYLGLSKADDNGYVYGTTYVIDFEDFDAHEDSIKEPGICQNRDADAFSDSSLTWDEVWEFPGIGSSDLVGTTDYLAYPPANLWDVEMSESESCSIVYSTSLTWAQLTSCQAFGGSDAYITPADNNNNITLSGTLYINVVSPYDYGADYGYYRVYQLLSQPFMIVVSKTTYVLSKTGINLLTMDIIAVYKEDAENTFKLILLTESAEYLRLSRDALGETTDLFQVFVPSDENNAVSSSDFSMLEEAETENECLGNKKYICSQLWQFQAANVQCTQDGIFTDFSGTYSIQFTPVCRDADNLPGDTEAERLALKAYCDEWLGDHVDEISDSTAGNDTVLLTADLSWKDEICDPEIFKVQFKASMQFYTDAEFSDLADDELFQVGEDTIYVKITTDYPLNTFEVFATELLNVWICTFDPLDEPDSISYDSQIGGCFDADADDNEENFPQHIYEENFPNSLELEGFELYEDTASELESNEVQFQFDVPSKVKRDELYIHAQIEVSLSNGRRRRMLLKMKEEANQMDHFVNKVGIKSSPDHKPPQAPLTPNHPHPQAPIQVPQSPLSAPSQTWLISLQSPWIIALGGLLAVVLTVNIIFMCYTNCIRSNRGIVSFGRRSKYERVVAADSDEASERDAINVVSN